MYQLEDLRIKIRDYASKKQGNALESVFALEILALLKNKPGSTKFFSRNERVRDRLLWSELQGQPNEAGLDLITDIQDLSWDGDLKGGALTMRIDMTYLVLAARKQVVNFAREESDHENPQDHNKGEELLYLLQAEIIKAEGEKLELRRKIHCFEKDIQSLKKGIVKAESRNLALNEELAHRQRIIYNLKAQLENKKRMAGESPSLSRKYRQRLAGYTPGEEPLEGLGIGGIIKRLFQNNT